MKPYFVYMLRCSDGSLYTGCTHDLKRRFSQHASGRGSRYMRSRRPFKAVYYEKYWTAQDGYRREKEIKMMNRFKKLSLIFHHYSNRDII
jgi:putative endonuclease